MKLRNQKRRADGGLSLVEMAVAVGVGSLVLMVVTMLSVYALRSFGAMGNHAILDAQNRIALDKMTRDIRQATSVSNYYADATIKWVKFVTPYGESPTVKYVWYSGDPGDPDYHTVQCEKGDQVQIYLRNCDDWDVAFFRRTALPGVPNGFAPATNSAGVLKVGECKMVEFNWKCSRSLLGKPMNTESVQRARVTLRNMN